jgi:hypothetical protein
MATAANTCSQLAGRFPTHLAGRVNTALNLLMFAGAFALQWGFGAAVDAIAATGIDRSAAFRWTFAALLAAQTLAYLWFLRRDPHPESAR